MPKDTREPQSYGSERDWLTGKTGETVNDPAAVPPPKHREFYDDHREEEGSSPTQGGMTSAFQLAENQQPSGQGTGAESPVSNVTTSEGGAKRGSYFRKRDYE